MSFSASSVLSSIPVVIRAAISVIKQSSYDPNQFNLQGCLGMLGCYFAINDEDEKCIQCFDFMYAMTKKITYESYLPYETYLKSSSFLNTMSQELSHHLAKLMNPLKIVHAQQNGTRYEEMIQYSHLCFIAGELNKWGLDIQFPTVESNVTKQIKILTKANAMFLNQQISTLAITTPEVPFLAILDTESNNHEFTVDENGMAYNESKKIFATPGSEAEALLQLGDSKPLFNWSLETPLAEWSDVQFDDQGRLEKLSIHHPCIFGLLDLTPFPELQHLSLRDVAINDVQFPIESKLTSIHIQNTEMHSVDLSQLTNLQSVFHDLN